MQSKKQLILWVLNVLNNESDENNPITQTKIADIISDIYPCDRKTVCRNIKFLQEMGYPIKKVSKGFYMERKVFSVEEVNYIKAAIMETTEAPSSLLPKPATMSPSPSCRPVFSLRTSAALA